jgi:hypothetical protein
MENLPAGKKSYWNPGNFYFVEVNGAVYVLSPHLPGSTTQSRVREPWTRRIRLDFVKTWP